MSRPRTWEVVNWESRPPGIPDGEPVLLDCKHCGYEALVPTAGNPGSPIIAAKYMFVIFDNPSNVPPKYWMPDRIRCRRCHREFGKSEAPDVR